MGRTSLRAEQLTIALESFSEGGRRLWRLEDRFGDLALVSQRETDDFSLLDGPAGGFIGGGYDKIR